LPPPTSLTFADIGGGHPQQHLYQQPPLLHSQQYLAAAFASEAYSSRAAPAACVLCTRLRHGCLHAVISNTRRDHLLEGAD
jgi:hypothetical protein